MRSDARCLILLLFRLTQISHAGLLDKHIPVAHFALKADNHPHEIAVETYGKLTSPPPPSHPRPIAEEDPVDARHVAFLLFGFIILSAVLFAMGQTKVPHVKEYTFLGLELFQQLFLAVMMFQAVDDLVDAFIDDRHHHHHGLVSLHAILWVIVAAIVAWAVQDDRMALSLISGIGGHFFSFFSAHAVLSVQERYFSDHVHMCGTGVLCTIIAVLAFFTMMYFVKGCLGAYPESDGEEEELPEWAEKICDVENDFGAMALAVSVTMCVRFMILGRYPHFDGIKPGDTPQHSFWHRFLLGAYAFGLFAFSACVAPYISILIDDHRHLVSRLGGFLRTFLAMSIAWAFLLWGHWEIYERQFHWSPMTARLAFGGLCTVAMILAILVLAITFEGRRRYLAIYAVAMIAAMSWEETFNHSLDLVLVDVPHNHIWKFVVAVAMIAFLLPIWAIYLKPLVPRDMNAVEKFIETQALTGTLAFAHQPGVKWSSISRSMDDGMF